MIKSITTDKDGVHVQIDRKDAGGAPVTEVDHYTFDEVRELADAAYEYLAQLVPPSLAHLMPQSDDARPVGMMPELGMGYGEPYGATLRRVVGEAEGEAPAVEVVASDAVTEPSMADLLNEANAASGGAIEHAGRTDPTVDETAPETPEAKAAKAPPTEAARALVGDYPHDEVQRTT